MKFGLKLAVSLALISLGSTSSQWNIIPALAEEAKNIKTQDRSVSSSPAGAISPSGINANKSLALNPSIDERVQDLDNVLKLELADGRLNSEEADSYSSALQQVAEEEAQNIAVSGKVPPAT